MVVLFQGCSYFPLGEIMFFSDGKISPFSTQRYTGISKGDIRSMVSEIREQRNELLRRFETKKGISIEFRPALKIPHNLSEEQGISPIPTAVLLSRLDKEGWWEKWNLATPRLLNSMIHSLTEMDAQMLCNLLTTTLYYSGFLGRAVFFSGIILSTKTDKVWLSLAYSIEKIPPCPNLGAWKTKAPNATKKSRWGLFLVWNKNNLLFYKCSVWYIFRIFYSKHSVIIVIYYKHYLSWVFCARIFICCVLRTISPFILS